jgi:group I intron endonuclease
MAVCMSAPRGRTRAVRGLTRCGIIKRMHIYQITNTTNGKIYIGQHTGNDLEKYLYGNVRDAFKGSDGKPALFSAIRKYGRGSFKIESLVRVPDFDDKDLAQEQLNRLERFFIRTENSRNRNFGYNIAEGGEGVSSLSWTPEMREQARQRVLENPIDKSNFVMTDEIRARISAACKGKKMPPMTWSDKIWAARRKNGTDSGYTYERRPATQETRNKISASKKGKAIRRKSLKNSKPAWNKGRTWGPETRAKLSEIGKKRHESPEAREALRLAGIKGAQARWGKK